MIYNHIRGNFFCFCTRPRTPRSIKYLIVRSMTTMKDDPQGRRRTSLITDRRYLSDQTSLYRMITYLYTSLERGWLNSKKKKKKLVVVKLGFLAITAPINIGEMGFFFLKKKKKENENHKLRMTLSITLLTHAPCHFSGWISKHQCFNEGFSYKLQHYFRRDGFSKIRKK